jgi:hypothetical protein
VRWRHRSGRGPVAGRENLDHLSRVAPALADLDQGSHQRANHLLEECVCSRPDPYEPAGGSALEVVENALRRRVRLCRPPEGPKVVLPDEVSGGFAHCCYIQIAGMKECCPSQPRVGGIIYEERVHIGARAGGEAGMKLIGDPAAVPNRNRRTTHGIDGRPCSIEIKVIGRVGRAYDLTERMYPRVRPAGGNCGYIAVE